MKTTLYRQLPPELAQTLKPLTSPDRIQAWLDDTPYNPEYRNRSPLNVVRDRVAHCFDGGVFAAAALRELGYPPLILDLLPEPGTDDDHILAVYSSRGCYGAVAKSNYSGLRYRAPVYRTIRELVMSYFEDFYNVDAERTLRAYTRPLNLSSYDRANWLQDDHTLDQVESRLNDLRKIPLISQEQKKELVLVDKLSFEAGRLGSNPDGLFKPKKP